MLEKSKLGMKIGSGIQVRMLSGAGAARPT
jgi:hypothetical protein